MLTIGDFARLVGVSVRMLRHYDQLGLLVPARVDPFTGYRYYRTDQLDRANRLVALKDLGFRLEEVAPLLAESVPPGRLAEMLRARRDELVAQVAGDRQRIRQIEARLRSIEEESTMSTASDTTQNESYAVQPLPALHLAQLTAKVTEQEEIGSVVGPLFDRVFAALATAGIAPSGAPVAYYTGDDDGIDIGVGVPVVGDSVPDGLASFTLPPVDTALVTTWVSESIDGIGGAWQSIVREAEARGLSLGGGACREVYTATAMDEGSTTWVVELQQPVS